ncbi:Uncharacterised protein [Mycobacterium tuberculosis]|nr:Uncharacterised protein [Mycobacterium tuberculosis]COX07961.1 Uncharacterised protein [Mycobacterium tuberculosis]
MLGGGSTAWAANALSTPPVTIFCVNASRSPCGTKWSANPSAMASAPENGAPVRAACRPSAPGARDSKYTPPTSGMNPMPTSGIATLEVSVTTRVFACALTPTPPPITMPSINAT